MGPFGLVKTVMSTKMMSFKMIKEMLGRKVSLRKGGLLCHGNFCNLF
ncbi:hypothetical protein NC653_023995 [Populus alba x Populus x berolinensis]|uniref:Uncharacterized protein n=2 Tax=Populus alba x Populus x berolinensis TaxID=444605 RepID=A0AAD6MIM0_9ROSI|nr:hypothetical protein NC653_023995 [Populus alba x Populus x berolinensis]